MRSSAPSGIKSTGVVTTSIAAWSLGAFAFYLLAGRSLGPDSYGLVAALQSVIIVGALPLAAFQWSVARVIASRRGVDRGQALAAYRRLFIGGTLAVLAAALLASLVTFAVASARPDTPVVALTLTYLSLAAMFPLIVSCGALQGEHRYVGFAWSYGASGVLRAPVLLLLLATPLLGVNAAMLAGLVSILVGATWAAWLTVDDLRTAGRPPRATWVDLREGVPAAAIGLIGIAALTNLDVIAAKLSFGGAEAGIFGATSVVAKSLLMIPQALIVVLLPRVAERRAAGDETGSLLAAGVLVMGLTGLIAIVIAVPFGDTLMLIAFGDAYTSGGEILVPFFAATTLLGALLILVNHHVARGDRTFAWIVGSLAVVDVALLAGAGHSSLSIIAIDAIVAAIGLTIHEIMYFRSEDSMLRGAGSQLATAISSVRQSWSQR